MKRNKIMDVWRQLCGDGFRRRRAHPDSESEIADKIELLLLSSDCEALSPGQWGRLNQVLAAGMAILGLRARAVAGVKTREWRLLARRGHIGSGSRPAWLDHPSCRIQPNGSRIYVSEPYGLSSVALQQLVSLAASGWDVHVSGASTYYPGSTVVVLLRPPNPKEKPDALKP